MYPWFITFECVCLTMLLLLILLDNKGSSSAERIAKVIASNTVLLDDETLEKTDLLRPNQTEDGNNKMKIPLHANQSQFTESITINDQEQMETDDADSLSNTGATLLQEVTFASEQRIPDPLNDHRSTSFSEEKRMELINEIQVRFCWLNRTLYVFLILACITACGKFSQLKTLLTEAIIRLYFYFKYD